MPKDGITFSYWKKEDDYVANADSAYSWNYNYVLSFFTSKQWAGPLHPHEMHPSFIEEMEKRGYDPKTIKFSIRKKK